MGPVVCSILLACAVALMICATATLDERGNHTITSFLCAMAAGLLVLAAVMSLHFFK